ncbi:MAG: hypothetical protein N2Z70_04290 [Bdellovibrionaceae bacterium]|jgi:cell division protein FtsB|nr:hypothetical protein [Pseudobdellovibrionaceae bacterium]
MPSRSIKPAWVYLVIFFLWGLWLVRSQILEEIYRLHTYQYFLQKKQQELQQEIQTLQAQIHQFQDPKFVKSLLAKELGWVDDQTLVFVFASDEESKL